MPGSRSLSLRMDLLADSSDPWSPIHRARYFAPLHFEICVICVICGCSFSLSNPVLMTTNGSLPLSPFTVLDLTHARAGPNAVRQLADWGARVIKIEAPHGAEAGGAGR